MIHITLNETATNRVLSLTADPAADAQRFAELCEDLKPIAEKYGNTNNVDALTHAAKYAAGLAMPDQVGENRDDNA